LSVIVASINLVVRYKQLFFQKVDRKSVESKPMESDLDNLTQDDFLELARRIKADYFPEWDAENAWVFECVDDCNGAVGLAVYKEKKIKATQTSREKLPLLLIHAICHAACHKRDLGHGKHWQNRMLKAARDAEHKYGDLPLAAALRNEVEGYQRSARLQGSGKNIVYSRLRDAVDDVHREFDKNRSTRFI